MNDYNYTLKILNFQDKNTILKNIQLTNNVYYIYLEQVKDSNLSCPNCGSLEITINFYYWFIHISIPT